jgi:hypothetical protein
VWSLALVVLGIVVYLIETGAEGSDDGDTVGSKIFEYTVLTCFLCDSYFSVVVTGLFLKPVMSALNDSRVMASFQKSGGYKKRVRVRALTQTLYMTLFGSSLAVLSSTYLYINLLLYFDAKTFDMRSNPWLNPLVIGNVVTLCCRVNRIVNQVYHLSSHPAVGNVVSMLNDVGMLFVSGVFKHASTKSARIKQAPVRSSPLDARAEQPVANIVLAANSNSGDLPLPCQHPVMSRDKRSSSIRWFSRSSANSDDPLVLP